MFSSNIISGVLEVYTPEESCLDNSESHIWPVGSISRDLSNKEMIEVGTM